MIIKSHIEESSTPYSPGYLGFNNSMRGIYAPWILLCTFIFVSGFIWQYIVGFPNWSEECAMFSGSKGLIPAVAARVWWMSFTVMAATIVAGLLANVMYFTSCGTVPEKPRSKAYGFLVLAIAIVGIVFAPMAGILGF